jgi:hypothetical protein
MKTLREQILARIEALGGESSDFYSDYSDYDLLEDYENSLRLEIEAEFTKLQTNEVESDE